MKILRDSWYLLFSHSPLQDVQAGVHGRSYRRHVHWRVAHWLLQPQFCEFRKADRTGSSYQCGTQPMSLSTQLHWDGEGTPICCNSAARPQIWPAWYAALLQCCINEEAVGGCAPTDRPTFAAELIFPQLVDTDTCRLTVVHYYDKFFEFLCHFFI